mmetsp:Transcript_24174/g.65462  ORF Transcript_24174/g.65462 Transcript_24174/m.65462 type:complete len:555 (-) Transcript_24174:22-1686(-)
MPALMEESTHFADGHQARSDRTVCVLDWRRLVAHHVRGRETHALALGRGEARAPAHLGHPRAPALLPAPRKGVDETVGNRFSPAPELEEAHLRIPGLRAHCGRTHLVRSDPEEALHGAPEAREDRVQWQVGAHLLVVKGVALLLELLCVEADVPLAQVLRTPACKRGKLGMLSARAVKALSAQVLEEGLGAVEGGHFLREGHVGVGGEAEKLGALGAEGEDGVDGRLVVALLGSALRGVGGLGGGAGHVRAVHCLAQGRVLGVTQHGQETRRIQRHHPRARLGRGALIPGLSSRGGHELQRCPGQTCHLLRARETAREGLGGIEEVVGEGGGQARQFGLDLTEARLIRAGEPDPAQLSTQDLELGDAAARWCEGGPRARVLLERLPAAVHSARLAEPRLEGHDLGLHCCMGLAQRRRVLDALEVTNCRPRTLIRLGDRLERARECVVVRRAATGERGLDARLEVVELGRSSREASLHGIDDMLGPHISKAREIGFREEGVVSTRGCGRLGARQGGAERWCRAKGEARARQRRRRREASGAVPQHPRQHPRTIGE